MLTLALIALVWGFMFKQDQQQQTLGPRALDAIRAREPRRVQQKILESMARLETDGFRSDALLRTNSLFNIHWVQDYANGGGGTFNRARGAYKTAAGEWLRQYDRMEDGVSDLLTYLLKLPRYAAARAAYEDGRALDFFREVVKGDGKEGYVGPANAPKAANYTAGLTKIYKGVA